MYTKRLAIRLFLGLFLLAPGAAIADEFSIVVVPDTQLYAERFPAIIEAQMQWIADNQAAENIIYVAQLGDLKDDQRCDNKPIASPVGGSRTEWEIVDDAFDIIETATSPAQPNGIPYGTVAGNHDFEQVGTNCPINWNDPAQRILTTYDSLFGPAQFVGTAYYGGSRNAGSSEDNFTLFESGGVRFIAINLGYREGPNPADVLNPDGTVAVDNSPEQTWADGLLKTHDDRLGIITSHYFMRCNNLPAGNGSCSSGAGINTIGSYGTQVYDRLSNNSNLFMMLGAHKRGEAYRLETRSGGMQPVHIMLANYQSMLYPTGNPALASTFSTLQNDPAGFGDSGFMRIMRFDTVTGLVNIETFSPPVPATPAAAGTGDQSLCVSFSLSPLPGGVVCETPAIAARSLLTSVYNPTITGTPALDNGLHDGTASNIAGIDFTGYADAAPSAVPTLFVAHGFTEGISRVEADGTNRVQLVSGRSILDVVVDTGGGKMYWAELFAGGPPDDELRRSNIDGTGIELLNVGESINGVDLDVGAGKLYYAQPTAGAGDTAGVYQANLNGTARTLVAAGVPTFVAVDPTGQQVYWTNRTQGFIRRANFNGTGLQTLLSAQSEPQDIELDVASGHMYWTDTTTREVLRANLDGTGRTVIIPASQFAGSSRPFGVALDLVEQKLYWTVRDASPNRIEGSNLDGTGIEVVSSAFAKDVIGLDLVRLP